MQPKRVIGSAAIVAIILGAAVWYEYTGTPQYSLVRLAHAVKAKDYETAKYYVDDDRLADSISRSLMDAASKKFIEKSSGLEVAMMEIMAPQLREKYKDEAKEIIKEILSGNETLSGKPAGSTGTLSPKASADVLSQLRIKGCIVSGNTSEVLIGELPQPNSFELQRVHLRMARIPHSRSWRIVEIQEVGQVFSNLFEDQTMR